MTPTPSRGGSGTSSMPACSPGTSSTSTTAASSWSSARTSRHPRPRLSTPAGAGCFSNGAQSTRSRRNAKRRRRMSRARKRYLAWAALALLTGALAVAAAGCGGGGQWDLVSASGDASLRLIKGGDVKEINVKLIPSWNDFIPIFKSPAHNTVDGKHYGVSLQWGPNVLLYRTDKIKTPLTSWSALYDPKYKGQITIPNNPIQIADAAFYLEHSQPSLGIKDPYELNKKQFDATIALLKKQRRLVKLYWNYDTDGRAAFANGDVSLGAIWPVDTLALQAKHVPVKEVIPSVGATGWADTWMLAKRAPHPNCAYLWMKYVTTPKVEAKQALVFGETPVNPKACPFMNKMDAGSCAKYHLNEPLDYYNTIKFWKTPIADCGNGKNDCMDYNAWQKAWTQVTG